MQKKFFFAGMILVLFLLITSCKKSNDDASPAPTSESGNSADAGTPTGEAVTKTIDAAGGQISSTDGTIQVIIPAGALSTAKQVSIQPISNNLPSGIGSAFRILPHGEQFSKPVTIVFSYKTDDLKNTLAEFLNIAYQDEKGIWQALKNSTVDKIKKKITVTTTHFSDWGYFKSLNLEPAEAAVEQGGLVELKVTTLFPIVDPADMPTIPIPKTPRELTAEEIKSWKNNGEGILISRGARGYYTAPDHQPAANPEAINVNIQMHRMGQFILVSNITVLPKFHVDYLQVDEDEIRNGKTGKYNLYLYGAFGSDPGTANRNITIAGKNIEISVWSPTVIVCKIDHEISGEIVLNVNGKAATKSNLKKFTGTFNYTRYHGGLINSSNYNALKESHDFILVYRGFGAACPPNVKPMFEFDATLAFGTYVGYSLSGTAAVTTPATVDPCVTTTSCSLPTTTGLEPISPLSQSALSYFKVHVKDIAGGIEVKMEFVKQSVLSNVIVKRANCRVTSYDTPRVLQATFEGFDNKAINLDFSGTSGLKLRAANQISSVKLSTSILIEAWDGTETPSHYQVDGLVPAVFKNK